MKEKNKRKITVLFKIMILVVTLLSAFFTTFALYVDRLDHRSQHTVLIYSIGAGITALCLCLFHLYADSEVWRTSLYRTGVIYISLMMCVTPAAPTGTYKVFWGIVSILALACLGISILIVASWCSDRFKEMWRRCA